MTVEGTGTYGTVLQMDADTVVKVSKLYSFTPTQHRSKSDYVDPSTDVTPQTIETLQHRFPALITQPWSWWEGSKLFTAVPDTVATAEIIARIQSLQHPNVVRIMDVTTYRQQHAGTRTVEVESVVQMERLLEKSCCTVQTYVVQVGETLLDLVQAGIYPMDIKSNNIMFRSDGTPVVIDLDQVPVSFQNSILIPKHCTIFPILHEDFPAGGLDRTDAKVRELNMNYYIPFGWPSSVRTMEEAQRYGAIDIITRFVLNCVADPEGHVTHLNAHPDDDSGNQFDPMVGSFLHAFEREWVGRDDPTPWPVNDLLAHYMRVERWRCSSVYFTNTEHSCDATGYDDDHSQLVAIALSVRDDEDEVVPPERIVPFQPDGFFATLAVLAQRSGMSSSDILYNRDSKIWMWYRNPPGWWGEHDREYDSMLSKRDRDRHYTISRHLMKIRFDDVLYNPIGHMRVHHVAPTLDQVRQLYRTIVQSISN